jgi:hypothetical protein
MNTRAFLTAAVGGLACAQAMAAPPAAAPDAWSKVPALPTACLSSQDQQWTERNNAAIAAVQESRTAQNEKNTALDQQANKALSENPMAMAQAVQQAMMDDPANAQKLIEKMTQTGTQAAAEMPERSEKEKQIEAESKTLLNQYKAALKTALGPAEARWHAFQKKMGWDTQDDFAIAGDPSWPQEAWQEWAAVQKIRDSAYAATCAQWWSATGQFQSYMKRYKTYLVQERIPFEKKMVDESKLDNYKLLNVPAGDYRTTTDMDAAIDYMNMASSVYGARMSDPYCRKDYGCE